MKSIQSLTVTVTLLVSLLMLTGCPNPPGPTETEAQKAAIRLTIGGTWNLQSVIVDAVDRTSVYQGLAVNFTLAGSGATSGNFTTTNGRVAWPANGSWEFTDDTGTVMDRSDGVTISVSQITNNQLVIGFTWNTTTYGPGRTGSVTGNHTFTFSH